MVGPKLNPRVLFHSLYKPTPIPFTHSIPHSLALQSYIYILLQSVFSLSKRTLMAANDLPCCQSMFWVYVTISAILVAFAGLMSGLTLGLMSLSLVDLEVLSKAGQPKDQKNAGFNSFNRKFNFLKILIIVQFLILFLQYIIRRQQRFCPL